MKKIIFYYYSLPLCLPYVLMCNKVWMMTIYFFFKGQRRTGNLLKKNLLKASTTNIYRLAFPELLHN